MRQSTSPFTNRAAALIRWCGVLALLLGLTGCAAKKSPVISGRSGPAGLAPIRVEGWSYEGEPGRRVVTPNYVIYATVANDDFLESVGQLMEGALAEYRRLAPGVPPSERPMECYLFANRLQWARFTKEKTGEDATIYLQINRGGYTVRDWYVAYFLGDAGTFCVASHEGFHQFAARHFRSRIPPFLEEGLACLFEDVTWDGRLPRWDLSVNYGRQAALRRAVDAGALVPLDELAAMHAGQVINRPPDQIAGFYAQCWGFARFLWEFDGGRYRPALQKILAEAASGNLFDSGMPHRPLGLYWDPKSARPMLEHYLGGDLDAVDREYREFLTKLARQVYESKSP